MEEDNVILAIDGACSNNNKENARMSVDVPWTWDHEAFERHYNVALTVHHSHQTNQNSELITRDYALLLVDMVFEVSCLHPQPLYSLSERVVVKSDSRTWCVESYSGFTNGLGMGILIPRVTVMLTMISVR